MYEMIRQVLRAGMVDATISAAICERMLEEDIDQAATEALDLLRQDAQEHLDTLQRKFRIYSSGQTYTYDVTPDDTRLAAKIATSDLRDVLEKCADAGYEVCDSYERACSTVLDGVVKEFIRFVARQEREHADTFRRLCDEFQALGVV